MIHSRQTPGVALLNPSGLRWGLICGLLAAAVFWSYGQVLGFEFIRYDDPVYITQNHQVRAGLSLEGLAWAFTATRAANWHPVTWISHMLDVHIWGLHAGGHHLTNLGLHISNTLILFFLLNRMTGCPWRSIVVASLFALHPLHVESVAWVAERKDVLSTFFGFLSLLAYARYAEHPGVRRYVTVLLFLTLGLLAKPMLVTLPFVMLLLDFWPLDRLSGQRVPGLLLEKIPLFILAGISSTVTFVVQQQGGAMHTLEAYPLSVRAANALVAYGDYIWKTVWPARLAVLYPHPGMPSAWQLVGAGVLLAGISWLAVRTRQNQPYLVMGWLWYLGTLVPVIGIVQVGLQSMADRYTYVPLVGLFCMAVWGLSDLLSRLPRKRMLSAFIIFLLLPALMLATRQQTARWRNSITLFEHALAVTVDNYVAHNNLGNALAVRGRLDDAIVEFEAAIRIRPDKAQSYNNLGAAWMLKGDNAKALPWFEKALDLQPNNPDALKNLARMQKSTGG